MKLISILLGFLCIQTTLAQELNVAEWQKTHPEILFIEQETYNSFSEEQLNKLGQDIIVFNHEIQESDIKSFLTQKSSKLHPNAQFDYSDPNADYIKQWIGLNKHIPIISLQEYNTLSMEERYKLNEKDALVFDGDFLTLNDIEEYEESH
jgi:hypothetical protein